MAAFSPQPASDESAARPAEQSCPFCPPPADHVLIERQLTFVKRDGYPLTKGHSLVIPRRHVATFFENDE